MILPQPEKGPKPTSPLGGLETKKTRFGGTQKNPPGTQLQSPFGEGSSMGTPTRDFGNAVHVHLYGNNEPFNTQKAAKLRNRLNRKRG